ncbi:MAG: RtcB family protein [Vicingus serpentipes]|nr:RtcB family protein [Vicingus serpentipes]
MTYKITGKDLIAMGYKPGKIFQKALKHINKHNLRGQDLHKYMESIQPIYIKPHKEPVKFHQNIKPETEEDILNIEAVMRDMNIIMTTPTIQGGAIMPDACPTGDGQIPVGGIAIAKNAIHPAMHSADICCSVMATNLGMIDPKQVLDVSFQTTHFGPGKRKEHGGWSGILYGNKELGERIVDNHFTKDYVEKALTHLGTQGDGNHFLFVGVSKETGETYIVTHHGSRGFGASVYKKGMSLAETYRKEISPETLPKNAWIPYDENGKIYWEALQIIRDWTKLNHESIHNRIAHKLKRNHLYRFWNEHNFVFKDEDLFYHAKGATPLDDKFIPDSTEGLRLIPLNMSQPILVVKGMTTENNLGFAPHGAGRNISRAQHKRNNNHKTVEEIFKEETKGLDIRFFSGNVDISELPSAYKDAETVKQQMHRFDLGYIVDEILPYGSIMAGDWQKNTHWRKK